MNISEVYTPLAHQAAFHQSMAKFRCQIGGYGGGKSLALLMEAIMTAELVPGSNSLILRRTFPDLQKTQIDLFLSFVPKSWYSRYNINERIVYFPNGSKIYFGYVQRDSDVNQYLSTEFVYIAMEESVEFSFRVFEALSGRLRVSSKIVDVSGNPVHPSLAMSTNPVGVGYSWIKKLFIDHKPVMGMSAYDPNDYEYFHSTVKSNPYTYTPEYVKTLEAMTGPMRLKALEGDLNVVSGQFFDNFETARHVRRYQDIIFHPWNPIWIGADWGMAHAFPIYWMTKGELPDPIKGGTRVVNVVFRERILHGMNAIEAAREIARSCSPNLVRENVPLDPMMDNKIQKIDEKIQSFFLSWERFHSSESNHTVADEMGKEFRKYGLPHPQKADANRVDGWNLIYQLLDLDELIITDDCVELIENLPLLTRNPIKLEDVLKTDSIADDVGDALRYGLKSFLKPGQVPQSVKDQQTLDRIQNPLAKQIKAFEMHCKKQEPGKVYKDTRCLPWQIR